MSFFIGRDGVDNCTNFHGAISRHVSHVCRAFLAIFELLYRINMKSRSPNNRANTGGFSYLLQSSGLMVAIVTNVPSHTLEPAKISSYIRSSMGHVSRSSPKLCSSPYKGFKNVYAMRSYQ